MKRKSTYDDLETIWGNRFLLIFSISMILVFGSFILGQFLGKAGAQKEFDSQRQNLTLEARSAALTEVVHTMITRGSQCDPFEVTFQNQTLHFIPTECVDAALRQLAAGAKG